MRFFLNHDVAFFAEILTDLDDRDSGTTGWNPLYHRSNCFTLPRKQEDIPFPYSIASAVNVLLAKFTIDNKIEDGKGNRLTEELRASKTKIIKKLHCLPISKEKMHLFSRRLEINLHQRLKAQGQATGLMPSMSCDIPGTREYTQLTPIKVGIPQRSLKLRFKAKRYFNLSLFALSLPLRFAYGSKPPPAESTEAKPQQGKRERDCCCCFDCGDCCCTCAICDCCSDGDCDCCDCDCCDC
jgi:hypothetical protein